MRGFLILFFVAARESMFNNSLDCGSEWVIRLTLY